MSYWSDDHWREEVTALVREAPPDGEAGSVDPRLVEAVERYERALSEAERERDEARASIVEALSHLDTATDVDTEQGQANRHAAYAQTELGRYLEHGYRCQDKEAK